MRFSSPGEDGQCLRDWSQLRSASIFSSLRLQPARTLIGIAIGVDLFFDGASLAGFADAIHGLPKMQSAAS